MVVSLDGFVCGSDGELDWEAKDDEVGRYLIPELLSTVDTMLLGRVLYQGFEQYWPTAATNPSLPPDLIEFAHWVVNSPKVVFSTTLEEVSWNNSRLVKVKNEDDIVQEVQRLKQAEGGDMVLFGGARIAETFVRLGLVDEYRIKLQPIVLGTGRPLFKDIKERMHLKLLKSKGFDSGVVALCYEPER